MAHLGHHTAAFVDGQLAPGAHDAALAHLADCAACRAAVADQRRLKAQMSAARLPEPPATLHGALCAFTASPPERQRRISRMATAGITVAGTVLLVLTVAYFAGGLRLDGDPVEPAGDALLAAFAVTASPTVTAAPGAMRAHGWPCPSALGALRRQLVVAGSEDVLVSYADGTHRLDLHEQYGVIDAAALAGARVEHVGHAKVWVIGRSPAVVTWQAPGVVLTLVTDLDAEAWRAVVRRLPAVSSPGAPSRVGAGLDRLASLLS